ncbi:hypothetical protein FRC07_010074 [Ceratobasidium sp. 392]|nr:hypothetical protein FRC07_010074 [Ceratobasidium sp. 392]
MLRKIRHNVKGHFHRPGSSQPTSALAQKAEGHNALPTTSATAATTGLQTTTSGSTAIEHIAAQPANPGPKAAVPTDKTEKRSAWPALSSLVGALDEGASAFGPIKSVVDGISRCIDIYEKNAKDREDYRILRGKLESLFSDLSEYCRGPVPLEMTTSIENLAK